MSMIRRKACVFTGHRPQKLPWRYDETDERCAMLKSVLAQQIRRLVDGGIVDYFSGMAEGTDLWFSQAVLELRESHPNIKLHCFIPHKGQAEKWSAAAQEQYRAILEQADSIIYVSREYHKDCMLERNRLMVGFADVLLAVYNGEYRGGTAATIRHAQKYNLDCFIIDPKTTEVTHRQGRIFGNQPLCAGTEKERP